MLHIPKIDDYLKLLTDDEAKAFLVINSGEYVKSIENCILYFMRNKILEKLLNRFISF